jgi:DNA-binding IclR family transcriptional regulator
MTVANGTTTRPDGAGLNTAPPSGFVDRLLALLECVGTAERPRNLSQITRQTGLPMSTAHRLLSELVTRGVVDRHDRFYVPGPGMSWMTEHRGCASHDARNLSRRSTAYLAEYVTATGLPAASTR